MLLDIPAHRRPAVVRSNWMLEVCVHVSELLLAHHRAVVWENPGTSMLWGEPAVLQLCKRHGLQYTALDMCMFGAPWKKYTRLLAPAVLVSCLEGTETRQREHDRPVGKAL